MRFVCCLAPSALLWSGCGNENSSSNTAQSSSSKQSFTGSRTSSETDLAPESIALTSEVLRALPRSSDFRRDVSRNGDKTRITYRIPSNGCLETYFEPLSTEKAVDSFEPLCGAFAPKGMPKYMPRFAISVVGGGQELSCYRPDSGSPDGYKLVATIFPLTVGGVSLALKCIEMVWRMVNPLSEVEVIRTMEAPWKQPLFERVNRGAAEYPDIFASSAGSSATVSRDGPERLGSFITKVHTDGQKYPITMLVDTGSRHAWILDDSLREKNFNMLLNGYVVDKSKTCPAAVKRCDYLDGSCAMFDVCSQDLVRFGGYGPVPLQIHIAETYREQDGEPSHYMHAGIMGAMIDSDFAKAVKQFTFIPHESYIDMEFGQVNPSKVCAGGKFHYVNTVHDAFWTIPMGIQIGESKEWTYVHGIVDTGATTTRYPHQLHDMILRENKRNPQSTIKFKFGNHVIEHGSDVYMKTAEKPAFLESDEMSLGASFLEHIVAQFDAQNKRIGFCVPKRNYVIA